MKTEHYIRMTLNTLMRNFTTKGQAEIDIIRFLKRKLEERFWIGFWVGVIFSLFIIIITK